MKLEDFLAKLWWPALVLALLAVPAVLAYNGMGVIALIALIPIAGWLGSRLLVHGTAATYTWLSGQALKKWQGIYYSFDDVQIRVYEDDDDLWFVVKDVLYAVNMKGVPDSFLAVYPDGAKVVPGTMLTALNSRALEQLLGKRMDNQSIRFVLWMQREVMKPWQRKKERGL